MQTLDAMMARTERIGRWPTTAELAQLRHDNAVLAKALGDVLAHMDNIAGIAWNSDASSPCDPVRHRQRPVGRRDDRCVRLRPTLRGQGSGW